MDGRSILRRTLYGLLAATATLPLASPAGAQEGVTATEIVVGTTNSVTGPIAVCGGASAGVNAYLKKVNDAGGVHGRKFRYVVLDDAYQAQRAIGNVRRLLGQENVFALLSGCGTATGAAVLQTIEGDTVPYLFPFVGLDSLSQPARKNVFSLLPVYGTQLTTIIDYAVKGRDIKTAAISMITIAGHEAWLKAIRDKLAALNIRIVDEQMIDVTAPDKTPFVTQMKSRNPDLVVMVDSSPGGARYVLEMQRQGWKPKLITGISTLTDESFLRAVGTAADGLVVAPSPMVPATDPRAKECVDALAAADKSIEPSGYVMFGCMGAKVFVEAMRRVGPKPTRDALRAELEKFSGFDTGISGTVSFSPTKHQGIDALLPIGIEGGQFKVLGPPMPLQ